MTVTCQSSKTPNFDSFLESNPVFTLKELDEFLSSYRSGNTNTRKALLSYYKNLGRVTSIRRGLYASVPRKHAGSGYRTDPFLLASKIAADAVVSHHSALEALGKSYSLTNRITYYSEKKAESFSFQGVAYHRVRVPAELAAKGKKNFGTKAIARHDTDILVTGFERTLVDVLTRPDLSGSWEEIWRSLESIEFFDLNLIFDYTRLLDNATTTAKVGFYLEQHKESLMVEETFLEQLSTHTPREPHYMERLNRKGCTLLKRWNLLVPTEVIFRTWGDEL